MRESIRGISMGKLFGTDGVRGLANVELTPEIAFKLGKASVFALIKSGKQAPKIIVGTDTRLSCGMLEAALCAGMCALGARVYLAGVIPTPAVAYTVRRRKFDAGVVISASHNPFQDNGIKFFNAEGYKLPDSMEAEIEQLVIKGTDDLRGPSGYEVGTIQNDPQALPDYVAFLAEVMPRGTTFKGLKIALDCANGATSAAAPQVFKALGADVLHVLHHTPTGTNINENCGSTHMEALCRYVADNNMDIGVAFDGDGDRCLLVDEKGQVVDGDQIMSFCGLDMKAKGKLANNTIVATVMSNLGLHLMGEREGVKIAAAAVGDRYVLEKMLEDGCNFGGEQSGHIIFLDYNTTGDGLLTALFAAALMREKNTTLSALGKLMDVLPQTLVNVHVPNDKKSACMTDKTIQSAIQQTEQVLAGEGRVLIRPSGTEPLIRIMLEGRDKAFLDTEANRLAKIFEEIVAGV